MEPVTNLGCVRCGSFEDLHGCLCCHKPICPGHRIGFGERGQYFCSMDCVVKKAFPPLVPKSRTGLLIAQWAANGAFLAGLAYFVYAIGYALNVFIHR
jgi:hypothetical protein